jgi:hypothetical protein
VEFVEISEKNRDIPSLGLRKNYREWKMVEGVRCWIMFLSNLGDVQIQTECRTKHVNFQ